MSETVNIAESQKTIPKREQIEEFEQEVEIDIIPTPKPPQRSRGWLVPLLVGTGLGVGLTGLGMTIMNRPTTKPVVTPQSVN